MFIVLIRTIVLYLLIIVGIRLLGKRQVGELEPSELVLALIIADLASVPMQDNGIPLSAGVIPIVTLLAVATILSLLTVRFLRFRALLCGKPSIVVENGVVQESELRKNRVTIDELLEELRGQGYADFKSVKFAVLETNGKLSVLPYASQRPVTAAQMGLTPQETGLPVILISDGRLLRRSMERLGLDDGWLQARLRDAGVRSPREVFLLSVDEAGSVVCLPKEGKA